MMLVLACQPRVTCFVYKVIRDLESIDHLCINPIRSTVVPTKSDSDAMFCLQSYKGLRIDISLVY